MVTHKKKENAEMWPDQKRLPVHGNEASRYRVSAVFRGFPLKT